MAKGYGFGQTVQTGTQLKVDPRIVLSSRLMLLSSVELESVVEQELAENPALERLDEKTPEPTDREIFESVTSRLRADSDDREFSRSHPEGDEGFDWMDLASTTTTLREHLRGQLADNTEHSPILLDILIESVNDHGYLSSEAEEIALQAQVSYEAAEAAIATLQACDPPGVGARSVIECLNLQLRDDPSPLAKIARKVLAKHLDVLIKRDTNAVVRKFKVSEQEAQGVFDLISSLSPYPGDGFRVETCGPTAGNVAFLRAIPEIVFSHSHSGWEIDVRGADPGNLRVNRIFQQQLEREPRTKSTQHIRTLVMRAERFMSAMDQRRQTLRSIAEYLIQTQSGFLMTGEYKFLADLTRSRMAAELGIHESTISRATMDKSVQIATGEVVQFDVFFDSSLKVRQMIAEILRTENPRNPLSDERIAKMLAEQGVVIARRTVNKYRDKTKLLNSRSRKSA